MIEGDGDGGCCIVGARDDVDPAVCVGACDGEKGSGPCHATKSSIAKSDVSPAVVPTKRRVVVSVV